MKTRILTTITAADIDRQRTELCQWATANGIDPHAVASAPGVTIERTAGRTTIVYRELQRSADGRIMVDPSTPGQAWTVRKATPMVSPLADHGYQPAIVDSDHGHPES